MEDQSETEANTSAEKKKDLGREVPGGPEKTTSTESGAEAQEDDNEATEEEEEEEEDDDGTDTTGNQEGQEQETNDIKLPSGQSREQNAEKTAEPSEDDLAKNAEATYSTRGRTGETALDILAESIQREVEVNLPREKEQPPTTGPSFLSDSLTEEERRTRTRYLPNVDGIHALRKQEVKGDLALARSMTPSVGVACTIAKKMRRAREDEMDVDESVAPSDDDKASEILRLGSKSMEFSGVEYDIPSSAFVAPSGTVLAGDNANKEKPNAPTLVESVMAFNPPRPPESVGPKKKHRMLRWERRPADIEVDLTTYRKTVQKTREELQKAMDENDRIEMMGNHFRRHYLNHLECMNEEFIQIAEETSKVQQECVSAADLLTSRTRSRGAGKSSYVMRDVLAVLRARGAELQEKGISVHSDPITSSSIRQPPGVGGLGEKSFQVWNNGVHLQPRKTCQGWATVGDKVTTPYGAGEVIEILPSGKLEPTQQTPSESSKRRKVEESSDMMDIEQPDKMDVSSMEDVPPEEPKPPVSTNHHLLPPRVAVRLPFGVGFFSPAVVEPSEDPASFSDSRLALRWRGMIDSARHFGEVLDVEAMANFIPQERSEGESHDGEGPNRTVDGEQDASIAHKTKRLLPFGSDLIPTPVGRGAFVSQKNVDELDRSYNDVFYGGKYVLGRQDNIGVPLMVREAEEKHRKRILLKARLRQLKNEVTRQRRIRQINQRTYLAAQERAIRIESLVSEMRTDLKSLKRRLDEEVKALGIDDAEAAKIMLAYYNRGGSGEGQEASPLKRSRNNPEMDIETEDEEEGYERHDMSLIATQEVAL